MMVFLAPKIFFRKLIAGGTFLPVFLFMSLHAAAQQPKAVDHADSMTYKASIKTIHILHAERLSQQRLLPDSSIIQSMAGKVRLRQDKTFISADSISLNTKTNVAEAFGNVHIEEEGGVNTTSDYMRYTGNDRRAYLTGNVKMKDQSIRIITPDMDYDMATKVSSYHHNGKIINGVTVLDSREGTYYGQTHDANFQGDVRLNDPKYKITTETLLYNTESKIATFTVPTVIDDRQFKKITTSDGYYDLNNKKAYFGNRPTIIDSTSTLIANEVATEDATGFSEARGNVVFKDTAQGMLLISDNLKTNRTDGSLLATVNPVAVIKQAESDSLFVGGDTIFSAKLSDRMKTADSTKLRINAFYLADRTTDSAGQVSRPHFETKTLPPIILPQKDSVRDSIHLDAAGVINKGKNIGVNEHLPVQQDSLRNSVQQALRQRLHAADSTIKNADSAARIILAGSDTLEPISRDSTSMVLPDSIATLQIPEVNADTAAMSPPKIAVTKQPKKATLPGKTPKKTAHKQPANAAQQDDNDRYFEVYNNVRIFSDSLQAAGDSLFYSFKDSIFRLYKDPIVWTTMNQLKGDTIYLYTENKKPKRLFVIENAIAINKVDTVPMHEYYNQVRGRTIDAKFSNGDIDSLKAKGSAESVYYMLDDNNKYIGANKSTSDVLDVYFRERQPQKVVFRSNLEGVVSPILQISTEEMKLKGFLLEEDRRPKSKYDLFTAPPPRVEHKPQVKTSIPTTEQQDSLNRPPL